MKTLQRAIASSLVKLPLFTLLCFTAVEVMNPSQVMAGSIPVAPPDSSGVNVGDSFAPADSDSSSSSAAGNKVGTAGQIRGAALNIVRSIEAQGTVPSVGGRSLPISQQQLDVVKAAISATGDDVQPAIQALSQQLASELGGSGIELDISVIGNSPADLSTAVAAANSLITSMNSAQLAAAIDSPTFILILSILEAAANSAEASEDVAEGTGFGLPLLTGISSVVGL
ncbi:MAG: hypothetical protein AAFQ40_09780 [Cyanobacteria bacterium J06623_5]